MPSTRPVGVFDSGVGGLSILAKIHQRFPNESVLYVADSAHAPYGPQGDAFILARSRHIMDFLVGQPVKAVVVACNTATASAVVQLREEYEVPIIAMEPAIKPAAAQSSSGVIGVLATEGTLASDKFVNLKSQYEGEVEIITMPCPGLVDEIEQVEPDSAVIRALLSQYLLPLLAKKADTIVLGCTHYSLIADQVQALVGQDIAVIDTDDAVSRRLGSVLEERALLNDSGAKGEVVFYTSGQPEIQQVLISRCWGSPIKVKNFS